MNVTRLRPPNIRRICTIWTRWRNQGSGLIKPMRRVLTNCYVAESGGTIARQTGIALTQSLFIEVYNQPNLVFIPFHEWLDLSELDLDGKWSADILQPQSFIATYESEHEFAFSSNPTNTENIFIDNNPDVSRIASLDDNRRGTERAQHVLIRAGRRT